MARVEMFQRKSWAQSRRRDWLIRGHIAWGLRQIQNSKSPICKPRKSNSVVIANFMGCAACISTLPTCVMYEIGVIILIARRWNWGLQRSSTCKGFRPEFPPKPTLSSLCVRNCLLLWDLWASACQLQDFRHILCIIFIHINIYIIFLKNKELAFLFTAPQLKVCLLPSLFW